MIRFIDDPYCIITLAPNGTTLVGYSGHLSNWEDPNFMCTGINIYAGNVALSATSFLISLYTVYFCVRTYWRNAGTPIDILYVITAWVVCWGMGILLYAASTHWQFGGKPSWGHIVKAFWYVGVLAEARVQPLRIEFILLAKRQPRRYARMLRIAFFAFLGLLGLSAVIIFFIGVRNGPGATQREPISYVVPWMLMNLTVALVDTIVSVFMFRVCLDRNAVMTAIQTNGYTVNLDKLPLYMEGNRQAAVLTVVGTGAYASVYGIGLLMDFGNTFAYTGPIAMALSWLFFTYSVACLHIRKAGPADESKDGNKSLAGSNQLSPLESYPIEDESGGPPNTISHPIVEMELEHF
ncbi:hypothetical protein DFS34DRAFT_626638 [Phlyctochytrium arcticum]|nr:hypothetical protein DFS34DRAFT_626638 [Phlyctochytrium arcticum]